LQLGFPRLGTPIKTGPTYVDISVVAGNLDHLGSCHELVSTRQS
jgi:hypothetical protein